MTKETEKLYWKGYKSGFGMASAGMPKPQNLPACPHFRLGFSDGYYDGG